MWCFTVTSDEFTVFEVTSEGVEVVGPCPAGTVKEALDGVLGVVRRAFVGVDVSVDIVRSCFGWDGVLFGVVGVCFPFGGVCV